MKRQIVAAAIALLIAAPAAAAPVVWTAPFTYSVVGVRNAQGASPATADAPVDLSNDGIDLRGLASITVFVKTGGAAMTAGGKLLAYLRNPVSGAWAYVGDGSLDLTVGALVSQSFTGIRVYYMAGRLAYIPSGLGQTVTIDINGVAGP